MLNERGDTMAKGISIGILGILLLTMGTQVALGANNSLMEKTGTIFHEYSKSEKKDSEIFACGKNGAIVRVSDIKQGIEFYMASGISETEAKEKSVNFYLKREAMYQKAIQEGYDVTEQEISDYLEYLKEFLTQQKIKKIFKRLCLSLIQKKSIGNMSSRYIKRFTDYKLYRSSAKRIYY